MAEGGGPEPVDPVEPVAAQLPSTESQKQTVGSLIKSNLRKSDEW